MAQFWKVQCTLSSRFYLAFVRFYNGVRSQNHFVGRTRDLTWKPFTARGKCQLELPFPFLHIVLKTKFRIFPEKSFQSLKLNYKLLLLVLICLLKLILSCYYIDHRKHVNSWNNIGQGAAITVLWLAIVNRKDIPLGTGVIIQ